MTARRIIPCLDVRDGRVVKGVRFQGHTDMGDASELAARYRDQGADELVFYDITASPEGRTLDYGWVRDIARLLDIPFSVAGGIRSVDQAARCLDHGADKVSINSPALERPELIAEMADRFGSQCVVASVDARQSASGWEVFTHGGRTATGIDAIAHAVRLAALGAGELLVTSMDRDGTRDGYDLELIRTIADAVSVPVVASGGVGNLAHLVEGVTHGHASAVLAASIFHFGESTIAQAHAALTEAGLPVRSI